MAVYLGKSRKTFRGGTILVGNGNQKLEQEKTLNVTENGNYDILPDNGYVISKAIVNVNVNRPLKLQVKTAVPDGTYQVITSDPDYDGLSHVNVTGD